MNTQQILSSYTTYIKALKSKVKETIFENPVERLYNEILLHQSPHYLNKLINQFLIFNLLRNNYYYSRNLILTLCSDLLALKKKFSSVSYVSFSLSVFDEIENLAQSLKIENSRPSLNINMDSNSKQSSKAKKSSEPNQSFQQNEESMARESVKRTSTSDQKDETLAKLPKIAAKTPTILRCGLTSKLKICTKKHNSSTKRCTCKQCHLSDVRKAKILARKVKKTPKNSSNNENKRITRSSSNMNSSGTVSSAATSSTAAAILPPQATVSSPQTVISTKANQNDPIITLPDLSDLDGEQKEPKLYTMVVNLGYAVLKTKGERQIVFKCFRPGCPFVLIDEDLFVDHLKTKHEGVAWNHFCNACSAVVNSKQNISLLDEMDHLRKCHSAVAEKL